MVYKKKAQRKEKVLSTRVKHKLFKKIQEIKKEGGYPTMAKTIRELIKEALK